MGQATRKLRQQAAELLYLLLALHHKASGFTQSLGQLLGEVRATLLQRPALEAGVYRRRRERQQAFARCQPGLFA